MTPMAASPKRRRTVVLVVLVAVLLVIGLAAAVAHVAANSSFTARGTFTLRSTVFQNMSAGDPCEGTDVSGYSDIRQYADVSILDSQGNIAGVGQLGAGTIDSGDSLVCDFPIVVPNVSGGSKFYRVFVGNEVRGSVTYSRADLKDNGFSMGLDDTTN